jgi:multicomponent K+:H+ antiporter subunit E
MKRWLPFPVLWALLVAMWLVLNESLAAAHVIVGAIVALGTVHGLALLQQSQTVLRRPWIAVELLMLVFVDIVRSNVAVARIVIYHRTPWTAGFVDVPLKPMNPAALAALACIITATPGTSWAGYNPRSRVLTMHILDLIDEESWLHTVQDRYARRLIEVFR